MFIIFISKISDNLCALLPFHNTSYGLYISVCDMTLSNLPFFHLKKVNLMFVLNQFGTDGLKELAYF